MTQNNLITIVTMWNKVNELSRENLPQQQIVTSSFHQCQQGSASSQCQCHSSNILVNANPSHPTPIRNRPLYSAISRPKPYWQNVLSGTNRITNGILYELNRFIGTE